MFARLAQRSVRHAHPPSTVRTSTRGQQWKISTLSTSGRGVLNGSRAFWTARRPDRPRSTGRCRRAFSIESIPSILVPPTVFAGLLLALWTWKCMMMVVFQDKIIYMPSMPPFARSEKMEEYTPTCRPVEWEEKRIKSLDGTKLSICVGRIPGEADSEYKDKRKEIIICYFQGNGSSLPPRLPILSGVLKSLQARSAAIGLSVRYSLVALSYRGYWRSSGKATQSGIKLDAQALLNYVSSEFSDANVYTEVVLWGQSIGSGIATTAAATYTSESDHSRPPITALVLETPFTSVRSMLVALYPQKWLPYRYLWPFLWNRWDSEVALRNMASGGNTPKVLLLPATRDEVVPSEEADKLEAICTNFQIDFERKNVQGALHNEATVRRDGQEAIAKFIHDAASTSDKKE